MDEQNRAHMRGGRARIAEPSPIQSRGNRTVPPQMPIPPMTNGSSNGVVSRVIAAEQIPHFKRTARKRKHILLGVVGVVIILVLGALATTLWAIASAVQPITAYQVGARQQVAEFIGGGGIVYPRQQLDLSYPVAERVISVLVKAGDTVVPNQPLIKLDPAQINTQIQQASNDLAAAQAYLNSVSGLFNPVTTAQAQQAYQLARNRYNALVAQASSTTMQNGNLISPMKGVVTAVNINPGEVFAANTILLTLMDQSSVTVRAEIPLANLQQVKIGMHVQVTPSALPDLNLVGIVSSIIPQANPQTDTFEVWVTIPNAQQMLLPGMSAFIRIQSQGTAYVVPRLAVLNPDHESIVFVVRNNHVYTKYVHVAGRSASSIYLDAGLAADDVIVLIPLDKLYDGRQVTITHLEHGS